MRPVKPLSQRPQVNQYAEHTMELPQVPQTRNFGALLAMLLQIKDREEPDLSDSSYRYMMAKSQPIVYTIKAMAASVTLTRANYSACLREVRSHVREPNRAKRKYDQEGEMLRSSTPTV